MSQVNVEKHIVLFKKMVEEKRHRERVRHEKDISLLELKSEKLVPIRRLLKTLMDWEVRVVGAEVDERESIVSHRFEVYENASSPSWRPGNSIFFDHPAEVEIAVPNNEEVDGVVIIRCSTQHPDANLLEKPFRKWSDACYALAEFLAKSTISMKEPTTPISDELLAFFYAKWSDKRKREKNKFDQESKVMAIKSKKLVPIRMLFKQIMEEEIFVPPANTDLRENYEPQKFQAYENTSSPLWRPGNSIFFDHPAQVEIAVPNNEEVDGVVVIHCVTEHKDAFLFDKVFRNWDEACAALSEFLAKNVIV